MALSASLLGALRCFEVAARHRNFTHAAAELHLTPSAVSQQIRHLEDNLGVALFTRLARGLALTPQGRQLQDVVTDPLTRLAEGIEHLRAAPGPLQVTCSPSFAMLWLMPRLARLHRDHPEIELKLVAEFQSVGRHDMQASGTDCAIRYDPVAYDGLHALTLMPETLIAVASPRYLGEQAPAQGAELLAQATLLHDAHAWDEAPAGIEWDAWWAQAFGNAKDEAPRAGRQEFNLSMLALTAARNHQGVAMGRLALVADDLQAGTLVAASPKRVVSPARYVLLTTREDDPRIVKFSRWLKKECDRFRRDQG